MNYRYVSILFEIHIYQKVFIYYEHVTFRYEARSYENAPSY